MQEIGFELVKPLITRRISKENIPRGIKTKARLLLWLPEHSQAQNMPVRGGKGRCEFCSRNPDQSTPKQRGKCNRSVCPDHSVNV